MVLELKQTPLHEAHIALNGRIIDFEGWALPVMYAGILEETRAVRSSTGIFDISHMGRVRISGDSATNFLQKLTSNDVSALKPWEAQYSLLMHPDGGILDDIIIYREETRKGAPGYLVVINAGNAAKDLHWMRDQAQVFDDIAVEDQSEATAMIAVQGPKAPQMIAYLMKDETLLDRKRFQYAMGQLNGVSVTLCRTGYTGEDGFEVIVAAEHALSAWDALIEAGAVPAGLGARDALRIEAGYPLYGHEIDETTSPVEAGLMWAVKLDKETFYGKNAIIALKQRGPTRKLMGLTSKERNIPRQGYTIYYDSEHHNAISSDQSEDDKSDNKRAGQGTGLPAPAVIGTITSGVFSPTVNHSIAMGYVETSSAKVGTPVTIGIRDKRSPALIVQKKSLLER